MADEFKAGDKVRVISGGPTMAVSIVDRELGVIYCVWFEGNKRHEESFQPSILEKVD